MIEQARKEVAVGELCQVLDVSESGYYAWRETKTSAHDQRDTYLREQIQTVFDYEFLPETEKSLLYLTMTRLMARRLAHT